VNSLIKFLRPLDYIVILLGLSAIYWSIPVRELSRASRVQIYQEGKLYQEIDLFLEKNVNVVGPLGITHIQIAQGKARIISDPSPRQYCVQKGWLDQVGQMAICLPNHTSLVIVGRDRNVGYDSLNY
jgi:hypothetical protein